MLKRKPEDGSAPRPRQKPGSACEECRRRKLRCDRERPQCKVCAESGVECHITTYRPPRGPKPGHIKDLESRVGKAYQALTALEKCFQAQQNQDICLPETSLTQSPLLDRISANNSPQISSDMRNGDCDMLISPLSLSTGLPPSPESFAACHPMGMSNAMQEELNRLYFDRVHMFAPMLHQRQYHSRAHQAATCTSRSCLQYAMWTLAAASSSQFQHISDSLYRVARQKLETLPETGVGADIEEIQTWILLTIYEVTQGNYTRSWISAGRAFRLTQLKRLFDIDGPKPILSCSDTMGQNEWARTEEKRRTFWMAYLLDRFLSIQADLPLTFTEQVISTRLPASEECFQTSRFVTTGLLSEEIARTDQNSLPVFTECILLVTIWGRSLSHKQLSSVENIYGDTLADAGIRLLSNEFPLGNQYIDPMVIFINIVAQAAIIYQYSIIESMPYETADHGTTILISKTQALTAAQHIIDLTKSLAQLSSSKAHPFTAIPLYIAAELCMVQSGLDYGCALELHNIQEGLRSPQTCGNAAQSFLQMLRVDQVPTMGNIVPDPIWHDSGSLYSPWES
ncbi:hypothetical protein AOCH_005158 [Aspergillus ochraceoroseus]|uniref:Zn(2)-C6 fungal-type domain-containing protein n=1 Tax=Aspergillus ochraceoroseus TaxID=138278 RepID=A0A0F8U908_9EURO|nr:hypothetical protein AOCH_005158 [Aspergillus ochraceoroseus]